MNFLSAFQSSFIYKEGKRYGSLQLRSILVPVTSIGSNLAWPLLIIGFLFHSAMLVQLGIVFFAGVVLFQLITLPVEFNASYRALAALRESGFVSDDEIGGSRKVLTAAAMTYVAAAAAAILQLIYFLIRAGILGGRDD